MVFGNKETFRAFHERSGYELVTDTQAIRIDEEKNEVSLHDWDEERGKVSQIVMELPVFRTLCEGER